MTGRQLNYFRKFTRYCETIFSVLNIEIEKQNFKLLTQKAVFWDEQKCLLISDLHLGKSHHFRKGGVALPVEGDRQNITRLKSLIEVLFPRQILFLGDMFHSEENKHVLEVMDLLKKYPHIRKRLVIGNHDIMNLEAYENLGLEVEEDYLDWGPFRFTHEPAENGDLPNENEKNGCYWISGHLHPGVRLTGKGRQSVTLPCFYFGRKQAVLPAYGNFTGLYRIKPSPGDRVFAIANKTIVPFI